jgi:hypothetical protein
MTDVITFGMPVGVVTNRPVEIYLRRLMRLRNAAIRAKAETTPP